MPFWKSGFTFRIAIMETKTDTKQRAVDRYRGQLQSIQIKIDKRTELTHRLVWVRLGLALPGLALIFLGLAFQEPSGWSWRIGAVLFVGFLAAATWHETNLWMTSQLRQRLFGYRRMLARCNRDWNELIALSNEACNQEYVSDLTRDLDVFGERSLFRWCSLAMTQTGAKTISQWLTQWASSDAIAERQSAVKELAADRPWREEFFETTCEYRNQQASPEGLAQWGQEAFYFERRSWVQWLTWLAPIAIIAGAIVILLSKYQEFELGQWVGLSIVLGAAALNFLIAMVIIGPIHDIFGRIGAANRELQALVKVIQSIEKLDRKQGLLARIRMKCFDLEHCAVKELSSLRRIMALAGMQRSPLMFIPYLVLQIVFLWDVRVLELLEKWKVKFGSRTSGWMEAIGMAESLFSAATLADEYPAWAYPNWQDKNSLSTNSKILEVIGVAHPLLKDSSQVPNSLTMTRDRPLLLVTGSNMAGKSTLLRSIGVNSLLSRLGAPVCAESWIGAVCELASSIRVQDSLQDGVSFFMAELKRLRSVVDVAQRENRPDGRQMMVLLDEILQGTNSRERQIAVEHVLDKLVECGCIVFTSTHDLEMAGNESIQRIAQVVHFREHFEMIDGQQVMRFDYIMRPGVTPTTNALKLLEMVGLRSS
jgi:hypothetical protein